MDPRAVVAARDNASWCDALCRAHGIRGTWARDAWTSPRRTPDGYPDAVTLETGTDVDELLARVEPGPGRSVKDSAADLDLATHGFEVLVEGRWLWRPPSPTPVPAPSSAVPVRDDAGHEAWEAARTAAGGPTALPRALLAEPGVVLLAHLADGEVVAGAVLTPGPDAVGLSNVFARPGGEHAAWRASVAFVDDHLGRPLVCWETVDDLAPATATGFEVVGAMRVWFESG